MGNRRIIWADMAPPGSDLVWPFLFDALPHTSALAFALRLLDRKDMPHEIDIRYNRGVE